MSCFYGADGSYGCPKSIAPVAANVREGFAATGLKHPDLALVDKKGENNVVISDGVATWTAASGTTRLFGLLDVSGKDVVQYIPLVGQLEIDGYQRSKAGTGAEITGMSLTASGPMGSSIHNKAGPDGKIKFVPADRCGDWNKRNDDRGHRDDRGGHMDDRGHRDDMGHRDDRGDGGRRGDRGVNREDPSDDDDGDCEDPPHRRLPERKREDRARSN